MRKRTTALLALVGVLVFGSSALGEVSTRVDLHWTGGEFALLPGPGGSVSVRQADGVTAAEPGQPDLPWTVVSVPLAGAGARVSGWSFEPQPGQMLASGVLPTPAWRDRPSEAGGPVLPDPDPAVYGGLAPWPAEQVLFRGVQIRAGRSEATFLVCPLRWDPQSRALDLSPGGTLTVQVAPGIGASDVLAPRRPVADDAIRAGGAEKRGPGMVLHAVRGGLSPTRRPSLDSVPVEFLVVTTEALAPAFQTLVDWKNRSGFPAAIRTVDAIARDYPQGVDLAESIRLFLKDAYALWGTRTVIIGGDPSLVPIRYARSYAYNLPSGVSIATDYYYACLDGNWNADGDNVFGEAVVQGSSLENDKVDLRPELRIGRVSALDTTQVGTWSRKYMKYVQDPDPTDGYLDGVLMLGEVLFAADWRLGSADSCYPGGPSPCVSSDGATECFVAIDSMRASPYGSFFSFDQLYEREYWWNQPIRWPWPATWPKSRQLNRTNTLASLNAGRNIVYQMGHGDRDRWAIGTGRLLTSDVAGMTNGPRYSGLAYAVNCNSAAVDADCVGEAWQFATRGGGVNYFGSTNLDFPATARKLQDALLNIWLNDPQETPGSAFQQVASNFGSRQGDAEGTIRFLLYSLILLGDPDLNVWRDQPKAMQVDAATTFSIGAGTAHVEVRDIEGAPLAGARVCLFKAGDAFGVALTDADGGVDVPFVPTGTGPFSITVTHPLARPYIGTGTVGPAVASWPVATDYTIIDDGTNGTRGNGNGRIEVGETVALDLAFANRGSAAATGVTAELRRAESVPTFKVSFADSTETIGDLAVGASGTHAGAFLLTVRESGLLTLVTEDKLVLPLVIQWQAQDGTHTQRILPEVYRPDLELIKTIRWETILPAGGHADSIPNVGETMALRVELFNQGGGTWSNLRARIEPVVRVKAILLDSLATFPPLEPGASAVSDTMRFFVRVSSSFQLRLIIEDMTGTEPQRLWTRVLRLSQVPITAPAAIETQGEPNAVTLSWGRPPNTPIVWGYRVYRADAADGEFQRLAPGFVKAIRYVKNYDLPDMTRYWYQVAAVDSSGIEGPRSTPTVASSSPGLQAGWPVAMEESRDACPTIENLNGWGTHEILFLSKSIYCFTANGDDYYDGDLIPSTRGVLTKEADGQNFNGKCAVADINGDGMPEVVALATNNMEGAWNPPSAVCVYDHLGHLMWSRVLTNRPAVSAPAIGNIDDDPESEIVFICGRWVFAFNHDGTPFADKPEGKFMVIPGGELSPPKIDFQYCSPALADLDGDGRDEIVFTTNSADDEYNKLYVINGLQTAAGTEPVYGTAVPGFPFKFSTLPSGATAQPTNASPAIADVTSKADNGSLGNPDGKPDIIVATKSRLWVFDPWANGSDKLAWAIAIQPQTGGTPLEGPLTSSPAIGDIDGDGYPDIAVAGGLGYLYVVNGRRGEALTGFIESTNERYKKVAPATARLGSPILADLDGVEGPGTMRLPEIVVGDNTGKVYALRNDGSGMNGFPFTVPGGKIGVGLAAWDVDRDGHQNLVIQSEKVQEVRILNFSGCPFDPEDRVANPWPAFRHDPRNSGSSLLPPGPTPVEMVTLEAQTGSTGLTLRWRTELDVRTFVLRRAAEPGGDWTTLGDWPAEQVMQEPGSFMLTDAPPPGTWRYRIEALDLAGEVRQAGEAVVTVGATALVFQLHPVRPNPFNPLVALNRQAMIRLDLPRATNCDLRVVDASGRTVRRLLMGGAGPGALELPWNGTDDDGRPVGSGVFFVRVVAEGQGRAVQKVVLLQ
jgi:hypothetical protein